MFYKLTLKAENKMYAVGWHEGETRESRGIMYYIFKKEWHYVGPELMDIIVGFDPDEDWEWGFHILPEMAEKITKEEAEEIVGSKIDESKLISERNRVVEIIKNWNEKDQVDYMALGKLPPLNI